MIAFFGASVTAQRNSYAKQFSKQYNDVKIFGYGGMHLNNAGICFIDDVLASEPSYCFIDFFSTGYMIQNAKTKEYLDAIIYKFSKKQCKLIFLFFPKKDLNTEQWYQFCKNYLDTKKIFYLDLTSFIVKDKLNDILKDVVHTTRKGSDIYADIILSQFLKNKDSIKIPTSIIKNKYVNIQKLKVQRSFSSKVSLVGNAEIIGVLNTVGPFSGLLDIKIDNKKIYSELLWDPWCHYTRTHFNLSFYQTERSDLYITTKLFNTVDARSNIDFTKYKKKFVIHTIYYIGNRVQILNIEDGRYICQIPFIYLNVKARFKQFLLRLK